MLPQDAAHWSPLTLVCGESCQGQALEANFLSKQMEKLKLMMAQSELVMDPKVGPLLPVLALTS